MSSIYLEPGDLVIFYRVGFVVSHWAVYSYDDKVIHFTDNGEVKEEDFSDVEGNSEVAWECKPSGFTGDQIVERARSKLGVNGFGTYSLATNNCEHFAKWCRYNASISVQADVGVMAANIGAQLFGRGFFLFGGVAAIAAIAELAVSASSTTPCYLQEKKKTRRRRKSDYQEYKSGFTRVLEHFTNN